MSFLVDDLLTGIKQRVTVPSNQALLDDEAILGFADRIIESEFVPLLISTNEDFYLFKTEVPTVADQEEYDIPERAAGRSLADVKLVDDAGLVRDLSKVTLDDRHLFPNGTNPYMFHFFGDKIALIPTPQTASTSIQYWYNGTPNRLVQSSEAALVQSTTTTTVTVASVPTAMVTGAEVDFLNGVSGHATLGIDAQIDSIASTTITFPANTIPSELEAGDYIALAKKTPVVQLPDECRPLLETLTGRRIMMAVGDTEIAKMLGEDAGFERKNLLKILEPRIRNEPEKVVNRRSLLKGKRARFRNGTLY